MEAIWLKYVYLLKAARGRLLCSATSMAISFQSVLYTIDIWFNTQSRIRLSQYFAAQYNDASFGFGNFINNTGSNNIFAKKNSFIFTLYTFNLFRKNHAKKKFNFYQQHLNDGILLATNTVCLCWLSCMFFKGWYSCYVKSNTSNVFAFHMFYFCDSFEKYKLNWVSIDNNYTWIALKVLLTQSFSKANH